MNAGRIPEENPIVLPVETTNGPIAIYGLPSRADSLADHIAIARMRARDFLSSASRQSLISSRRTIASLRERARQMKNERPIAFVGLIAGTAFVLGMALRIWRSQRP